MNWISIIVIAYFLNAIAVTVDKFLLNKKITNPAVYAFFISALSLLSLVLIPFGFHWYGAAAVAIALASGIIFAFALYFMFLALSKNEASRITPFIGGWQPIIILFLAWIFLGERLGWQSLLALAVIIAGTVLISWQKGKADRSSYLFALMATALFAISYTANKYIFISQDFITGFVWTRVGAFLGALIFLFSASNRRAIAHEIKAPQQKTSLLFVGGQVAGALSFILVNYAIAISPSVAVANALQGLQYVFLLIIAIGLGWKFPKLLNEKLSGRILLQKIISIILIVAGLALLSWN